ncbi:hypothetical protein Tco_0545378 [Tanacetum coccineum]
MSPDVEETPNADISVRNTVNGEEGIPRDFPTSSATSSAMREFCEKHYAQILPFMAEKAHSQKLKDVRSRLTYRKDIEQETKSALRHKKIKRRGGKQKEVQKSPSPARGQECILPVRIRRKKGTRNIKGANGPTQVTNSWKVRIAPEEGIGRGSRGKPGGMRAKTCLNLRTRS